MKGRCSTLLNQQFLSGYLVGTDIFYSIQPFCYPGNIQFGGLGALGNQLLFHQFTIKINNLYGNRIIYVFYANADFCTGMVRTDAYNQLLAEIHFNHLRILKLIVFVNQFQFVKIVSCNWSWVGK